MRKSIKSLVAILFVAVLSCHLFAADGTVTFVKGKVEVKKGNSWVTLSVGDKVKQSEMINTGFQSEAKIKLMDNILYLGPVTRVTLDTLASSSETDKVNVYLTTGSARSKINRTDTKRVSYTVRTPIAVASVRGTDFSIDGQGNVVCNEGKVAVIPVSQLKELVKNADDDDEAEDEEDDDDDEDDDDESDDSEDKATDEKDDTDEKEDASDVEDTESDTETEAESKEEQPKEEAKKEEPKKEETKKEEAKKPETKTDSVPDTKAPDLDLSSEAGLAAMENALNLDDVGETIGAQQSIKVSTNSTGGAKHNIQQKAEKVLGTVTTESTKPQSEEGVGAPDNNIGNITKPTSGSISVNINGPKFGSLDVQITLPDSTPNKDPVTPPIN